MDKLLCLIFKDKQVESYNLFVGLEDIKCMLWSQRFCLDSVESRLAQVENFIVSDFASKDLTDPLGDHKDHIDHLVDNVHDLTIISSNRD